VPALAVYVCIYTCISFVTYIHIYDTPYAVMHNNNILLLSIEVVLFSQLSDQLAIYLATCTRYIYRYYSVCLCVMFDRCDRTVCFWLSSQVWNSTIRRYV
jgi:hypothetical protein